MIIDALLTAIQHRLEIARQDGVEDINMNGFAVEIVAGKFSSYDLTRDSFRAPALRVSFLGAAKSRALPNEQRLFDAALAVFVITDSKSRLFDGVKMIEWIAGQVELWKTHDISQVHMPRDIRLEALYSGDLADRGVVVHGVTWVHPVRLGRDEIGAGVYDPAALVADPDRAEVTIHG